MLLRFGFAFRKRPVQISFRALPVLTEDFRGTPQSFQSNLGYYPKLRHDGFFLYTLECIISFHPIIRRYIESVIK